MPHLNDHCGKASPATLFLENDFSNLVAWWIHRKKVSRKMVVFFDDFGFVALFLGFLGSQANNDSTRFRDKHTRVVE